MRMLSIAVAALLCQEDVLKRWKHPWTGCGAGTAVRWKVTHLEPGFEGDTMVHKEVSRKRTETVAKVEKEVATLVTEEEGSADRLERQVFLGAPAEFSWKASKAGEEEVKVGGRAFRCDVIEIKLEGKNVAQATRIWACADAPVWALKQTWTSELKGQQPMGWSEETIELGAAVTVAGKEYTCAVVRRTSEVAGTKAVDTEWRHPDLPGGVARRTRQCFLSGREIKEAATTEEMQGFERK